MAQPVSRPLLRRPRKRRILPLLIGLLLLGGAAGVGHHWVERLTTILPARQEVSQSTQTTSDEPFPLRAAWRDVDRRTGQVGPSEAPGSKLTPVISVLDDVAADSAPTRNESPAESLEPSPEAALLAERMAAAAASEGAARPDTGAPAGSETQRPPAGRSAVIEIAPSPSRPPAPTAHVPLAKPGSAAEKRPDPAPASQSAHKTQRAPGMVGLGGPPAAEKRTIGTQLVPGATPPPPVPRPRSQKRSASDTAPPAAPRRTAQSARAESSSSGSNNARPRKPYRRSVSSPSATEPPIGGMTIFRRFERMMP